MKKRKYKPGYEKKSRVRQNKESMVNRMEEKMGKNKSCQWKIIEKDSPDPIRERDQ